jgi:thiamine-phosphate pyrophosphorylase
MNSIKEALKVYAVTDRRFLNGRRLVDDVEKAIQGGATFIQYREKSGLLNREEMVKEAKEIKALCHSYRVPFVIDDDVAMALEVGADGVHVGQEDRSCQSARAELGDQAIIGVSAQTVEEAIEAQKQGADYLGVGAVFPTQSKDDAMAVSKETLKAICEVVTIPVIAIGGVTAENTLALKDTGIVGVAVISAIFGAKDITAATRELSEAVKNL